MSYSYANQEILMHRLLRAYDQKEKITFLIGSGLTCSVVKDTVVEPGVSSMVEIVQEIKNILTARNTVHILEREISNHPGGNQYQMAMQLLLQTHGQSELNRVIVDAVLKARNTKSALVLDSSISLKDIELDGDNWYLRSAVDTIGKMFVEFPGFITGPILTSNFDPLLEISVRRHGGNAATTFITNDGTFLNTVADNEKRIVHFHGFWRDSDTLHTADQITRQRAMLKNDLRTLLQKNTLVVLGYGGWDDVFTKTLIDEVNGGGSAYNILWTFFEQDEHVIAENHGSILKALHNSIGQRVILYKGINSDVLFPKLYSKIKPGDIEEIKTEAPR